jgi:hypothetical protein
VFHLVGLILVSRVLSAWVFQQRFLFGELMFYVCVWRLNWYMGDGVFCLLGLMKRVGLLSCGFTFF